MASDSGIRPVSGEILGVRPGAPVRRPADAVDASFETIAAGPARPGAVTGNRTVDTVEPGLSFLGGATASGGAERGGPAFWAGGLLAVAAAFWLSGGHAVFLGPKSTPIGAEPAGFEVFDLSSRLERSNGRSVLLVDGAVQNTGMQDSIAPSVVLNVESDSGKTTRYLIGLGSGMIGPGDTAAFSSRLDAPKDGVKRVYVTFEEK